MHRTTGPRGTMRGVMLAAMLLGTLLTLGVTTGQEAQAPPAAGEQPADPGGPQAAARKAPRGRLPAYFARVVSAEQRTEIYAIQARYAGQVQQLEQQIEALEKQRDEEVRGVLSEAQQRQVDEMVAAAQARRRGLQPDPDATSAEDTTSDSP